MRYDGENRAAGVTALRGVAIALLLMVVLGAAAMASDTAAPVSEGASLERAQELVAKGDVLEAMVHLEKSLELHPRSDVLRSLYGRLLYKAGRIQDAEEQFRMALAVNKDSQVAKMYIKEMRRTRDLLEDREISEWISIAKDKAGDILVIILGVWGGVLLSSLSQRLGCSLAKNTFQKALRQGDFDEATDILENLMLTGSKAELRRNLRTMLSLYGQEQTEGVIIDFVDDDRVEAKLLFFLRKMVQKSRSS